ncbi:hypothetical protein [Frondihabitans cladoniiphilus]|uniref:Uncharacterized protein n=1 Tax=Frondihabitans cladoniiphilus TaxID=715785 RepID=A0ABP8VWA0_9MICO
MSDTSSTTPPYDDSREAARFEESEEIVTNDAVAGETVEPGIGEGNDGPTGGSPREGAPYEAANDLDGADVDLDEEP